MFVDYYSALQIAFALKVIIFERSSFDGNIISI